ncbi:hypothetical protein [Lysinibacillus fusiformis]|uniref:hypothetical protein n=1 Tax=Lysinibacillus fusiformis TaxID=28031 RepID=UPI0011A6A240|nr:hypothetical protein [Lysinibacillus fusiformis]
MKFFDKLFSSTPGRDNKEETDNKVTIRELSRKRSVIQSNMNSNTISSGIKDKSEQMENPKFAEIKLKETLSKLKVN